MDFKVLEIVTPDWAEFSVVLDENEIRHLIEYKGRTDDGQDRAIVITTADDMLVLMGLIPMYDVTVQSIPRTVS
jgi:hypothetical protein